jgi:hypothetical protein
MRRNLILTLLWVVFAVFVVSPARADEFKLINSEVIKGRIAGPNEDGLVISLEIGGYSERIPWTKFSQETLKNLAKELRLKSFVEPFIEIPLEVKVKRAAQERQQKNKYTLQYEPKVTIPANARSVFGGFATPIGLLILGLLYVVNLVAAWEIAVYKHRSTGLICGASALLPVVGPIIFLSVPGSERETTETSEPSALDTMAASAPAASATAGSSLSMAKPKAASGPGLQAGTFKRGEFTFNRRFFETKFPGFFRVVLGEAEKDFVLVFRTDRDEHIVRRIPRITANDIHILLIKGAEISLSFDQIREVQLRPKQANE